MSYPKATILDVETTGLSNSDRAIEIALVQFSFDPTNFKITSVDKAYLGLSDPGFPIPYHARNVHGITDSLVAGKSFNYETINQIISDSDYLIAHNASFDRRMLSRDPEIILPSQDRWRCSCHNIDWKERHHFPNKRLDTIRSMLSISNIYSHQAMADVEVVLEVLMRPAILAEIMGMVVEGDIKHAVPPAITITLPDRTNVLSNTIPEKPTKTKTIKRKASHVSESGTGEVTNHDSQIETDATEQNKIGCLLLSLISTLILLAIAVLN